MIHYHGTPISPRSVLSSLAGRCFTVSYARPDDVEIAHRIGQSVMIDNGAFSAWRGGVALTDEHWRGYYAWAEIWLACPTTWAVIPDVIEGDESDNDALVRAWPFGHRGAPVWHLHESLERLLRLCESWWRVCFGSSGEYAVIGTPRWRRRVAEAFDVIADSSGRLDQWVHMLRGMQLSGDIYPFASVDSTDVARNHNRGAPAADMAARWDAMQCPTVWRSHGWDLAIPWQDEPEPNEEGAA